MSTTDTRPTPSADRGALTAPAKLTDYVVMVGLVSVPTGEKAADGSLKAARLLRGETLKGNPNAPRIARLLASKSIKAYENEGELAALRDPRATVRVLDVRKLGVESGGTPLVD